MRPAVAFGAAGAGAYIGVDVDVGASYDGGENDRTGSSGVAPPEGETLPRGDLLY